MKQPQDRKQTKSKTEESPKAAATKISEVLRLAAGNLAFSFFRTGSTEEVDNLFTTMDDDQVSTLVMDVDRFRARCREAELVRYEQKLKDKEDELPDA